MPYNPINIINGMQLNKHDKWHMQFNKYYEWHAI